MEQQHGIEIQCPGRLYLSCGGKRGDTDPGKGPGRCAFGGASYLYENGYRRSRDGVVKGQPEDHREVQAKAGDLYLSLAGGLI